jgi:hypothetical protein
MTVIVTACSHRDLSPGLVDPAALGSRRGLHFARVQTHFHSPYSFDACDSGGIDAAGNLNLSCLHHIKTAVCDNHVNLTFLTDHVDHMAEYEFSSLVQVESGDTLITNGSSEPVGNRVGCADGFGAVLSPGLEGRLLAIGMQHHVTGTIDQRKAVYGGESATERAALEAVGAIVGIPHTESRTTTTITGIAPSFIEIYNVHANTDPKIRKASLGLPPFLHIAKFLSYLIDPMNALNADYLFMEYFEQAPLYLQKWNALLAAGIEVAGVGGLDSHENVFSQKATDGERIDSHRRMTRIMSNFVMTPDAGPTDAGMTAVKNSIKAGRVYFVLEGIGTPSGLDFYGTVGGTTVEMGVAVPPTVGVQTSEVVATVPTMHESSLFMDPRQAPVIEGQIHYIDAAGTETLVASGGPGDTLRVTNPATGHYRLHVYMAPLHTADLVSDRKYATTMYPWVISNPVRVVR